MQLLKIIGFMIWTMLKLVFFFFPRAAWRTYLEYQRGIREFNKRADRLDAKLPPQLTINDPTVREAELIVDRFLRREAKRRRK